VIVATNEVAKEHNEPASMWFDWAGVLEQSKDVSKWKDRYDGPPIEKWPISFGEDRDQIRAQILVRLGQV
jgi:hypothetical protein